MKIIIHKIICRIVNFIDKFQHEIFLLKNFDLKESDKIRTHLSNEEKRILNKLSSKINNGVAIEIGSYIGSSACFIAHGLNGKLICIDTWENDAMSEGKKSTLEEFNLNTALFSHKIIKIRGYSENVVSKVRKITTKIDFLFIDGDHSFEGCKKDWDLYSPLFKKNTCVVFHDCGWSEGVNKVINEQAKPKMSSYYYTKNMFWGYIS